MEACGPFEIPGSRSGHTLLQLHLIFAGSIPRRVKAR